MRWDKKPYTVYRYKCCCFYCNCCIYDDLMFFVQTSNVCLINCCALRCDLARTHSLCTNMCCCTFSAERKNKAMVVASAAAKITRKPISSHRENCAAIGSRIKSRAHWCFSAFDLMMAQQHRTTTTYYYYHRPCMCAHKHKPTLFSRARARVFNKHFIR